MSQIRAFITILNVIITSIMCGIILWTLGITKRYQARKAFQLKAYRALCKAWRIEVTIYGNIAPAPTLLISNHCTYIDVFILGSIGNMRFTPKSDVKSWPVVAQVIRAFDVIFVDRTPAKAKEAQHALHNALSRGDRICIFPEGTTNDGRSLKPYKSSLLSLAEQREQLIVQPLVVKYTEFDGKPVDNHAWERIAWYGDADLLTHLWSFSKARSVKVDVHCLQPMSTEQHGNRKMLTKQAYDATAQRLGYSD